MKATTTTPRALLMMVATLATTFSVPVPSFGNSIADAVEEMDSGRVRFEFPARRGVRGDGSSIVISNGSSTTWRNWRNGADRRDLCDPCRIQVTLNLRDGEIRRLRYRVGARPRSAPQDLQELGVVQAEVAREFLMRMVNDTANTTENIAEEALEAAILSEAGVPWQELMQLARNNDRSEELRSTALFWLGQEAQDVVTEELEDFATDDILDLEVRKSAIFALSQHPDTQSIPSLQRIVKEHRHPEIRRSAIFWLAQKESPEVMDFFEEILSESNER
jgi:hypothetical protein